MPSNTPTAHEKEIPFNENDLVAGLGEARPHAQGNLPPTHWARLGRESKFGAFHQTIELTLNPPPTKRGTR